MTTQSPSQHPDTWNRIVDDYDRVSPDLMGKFTARALCDVDIPDGARAVDVAAGTGAMSVPLARKGVQVLATDFADEMLQRLAARARREQLPIETQLADGQDLHMVASESCDLATSSFGLIFFPDLDRGFAELYRMLRVGGRAIVIGWGDPMKNAGNAAIIAAIKAHLPGFAPPGTPEWMRLSSADTVKEHMERAGFHDIGVTLVTETWTVETNADLPRLLRSAPPLAQLFDKLGADETHAIAQTLGENLRAEYGAVAELPAEAWIAVGTR